MGSSCNRQFFYVNMLKGFLWLLKRHHHLALKREKKELTQDDVVFTRDGLQYSRIWRRRN
ncbi:hypothetical protein DNTS_022871 [Danionella cerebrum]|uniref:Uncharacterized protein n=1 Tax=Danionella cerebrum TaxID=2873325 RepID=A0A553QU97_9TELE|nr:hypothetical protein DNTS_022871 [Danionella translucida]